MTERGVDDGYWDDRFIQKLCKDAKMLFFYLWTNKHCNQAGCYEVTLETISFETRIEIDDLPALFKAIEPKATWFAEDNIVWVRNFVKRQTKSPKFLVAVAKSLKGIRNKEIVAEVVAYNERQHSLSIPYQYNMDIVSIPSASVSVSNAGTVAGNSSDRGGSGGNKRVTDPGLIFNLLVDTFSTGWGWMPKSRETAQLRDLGAEMAAAGGVREPQVIDAFKEAAVHGQDKLKVSYVRAILLDWLGVPR